MKNKKGFTLIELLATIAILAILATISGISISKVLNKSKTEASDVQLKLIENAAHSYVAKNLSSCKNGCSVTVQVLIDEGYIDDTDNISDKSLTIHISKLGKNYNVTFPNSEGKYAFDFTYTGSIQTYIVPETGTYIIEAAGAEGTQGNKYLYTGSETPTPGKGAKLTSQFALTKGDELTIVVGGVGSVTQATAKDGTSGAGGGGTFIFKTISSVTDSTYQITKSSKHYETLLVAAGGGGTGDSSYKGAAANGYDGVGATWIEPGGTTYSTTATTASSSSVLGIAQFRSYDLKGGYYTRNSGVCKGGFGGGGCMDDSQTYGGGWSGSSYQTQSFSSGSNTSGETGSQSGNGYARITKQ